MSHQLVTLDKVEVAQLESYERVIERGVAVFSEVGSALLAIRDGRLYRAEHDTFEIYCHERWSMSRPRAYQLIESANIISNLSTVVDIPAPISERQLRPLAALEPEEQRMVWKQAVEESGGKPPTAIKVEELKQVIVQRINERRREAGVDSKTKTTETPVSRREFIETRERMRINGERNARVWSFIEAIEVFSDPALTMPEVAAAIKEMDGPDVAWVTQAKNASRHLALLIKELQQ
jgi:hypothetical protein